MLDSAEKLDRVKREVRRTVSRLRHAVVEKDQLSELICRKLIAMPEYLDAQTIMLYVSLSDEVHTGVILDSAFEHGKRVVVPYCDGDHLGLFHLHCSELGELEEGSYGIMEPVAHLRNEPGHSVSPDELDLIVVPGVAFDARGGRLGRGKGYYDSLLGQIGPETSLIAPAFHCQMVDEVPMQPHDVGVHKIITERAVFSVD